MLRSVRAYLLTSCVILAALSSAGSAAWADAAADASARFEQGQRLYSRGSFAQAIVEFEAAHRIAPHPAALFNIARCYENLGRPARALSVYVAARAASRDPDQIRDITRRIEALRARPVKVFITSQPKGARITVDARDRAEPQQTPAVLELAPGPHLLLVEHDGYLPTHRRIVVEMGTELPVPVELAPVPAGPRCAKPTPCPVAPACPPPLFDPRPLHLHLAVIGAFGLTTQTKVAGGPGIEVLASLRRLVFGGRFVAYPIAEEAINPAITVEPGSSYSRRTTRWLLAEFGGGMLFPLQNAVAHATVGLGFSSERVIFAGTRAGASDDFVKETFALSWSLGGGLDALVTSWFSVGLRLRAGAIHGQRVDRETPTSADSGSFPYGELAGTVSFHL